MIRFVIASLAFACASAIVCRPETCQLVRCAAVTEDNCAGTVVSNGGYCGCCDACVMTLAEGDSCYTTMMMGVPPTSQCARGLVCEPASATCKKPGDIFIASKRAAAMTCAERVQQMNVASQNGLPLLGQFKPRCDSDGSYSAVQCHGSECYCTAPGGEKIDGYAVSIGQSADMDCKCARDLYAYMQTGLIGRLFHCADNGNYQRYQCTGSVCFCADHLGNMKPGSPTVNIGNIGALQC